MRCSGCQAVTVLFAGVGASYFITERTALYAGYRLPHPRTPAPTGQTGESIRTPA
jgi:hypothetical protein